MSSPACKTVGHSSYAVDDFIGLAAAYGVTCIVDIRSVPYSRYNPQYNRETLKNDLQLRGFQYIYMGDRLGARYDDPGLFFPDGRVDFSLVVRLQSFQEGIDRLIAMLRQKSAVALMCAEKDPLRCHRFALVGRELTCRGVSVEHIMTPEMVLSQQQLEEKLLQKYCKQGPQLHLFDPPADRAQLLQGAYLRLNREIAWIRKQ